MKIIINDKEISKNAFIENAIKCGAFLSQHSQENDVILISKKTSFEQIECFIGCILYKRIPLIIQHPNQKISQKEFNIKINHIKNICGSKLCICDQEYNKYYQDYFDTISNIDYTYSTPLPNISPEDTCFYQLSSGTTSLCKIIKVLHKEVIENIDEYSDFINFTSDDTIISWLPLYHDMGLIACFLMPLIKGANFVHINNFDWLLDPSLLFKKIEKYKGTVIYLPNFAFNYIFNRVENIFDLSSLKQVISCSEPTSSKYLLEFANKFNIDLNKIKNCYALAENIFAVSQTSIFPSNDNRTLSCGKILPGISVLISKDKKDVTNKEDGEIWIKSNYLSKSCTLSEYGYYNTGDIGYIQNEELHILGRQQDKILSFGNTIFPDPIEQQVGEIEGIIPGRVSCIGIYDESFGTEIVHIVAESESINIQNIIKKINNILENIFNISGIIHIVPTNFLVKTSSGKISRYKTRDKIIHH